MGPTVEELNKVLEIKNNIKQAIADKGVEITDDTAFADYPSKIESIESGGDSESVWNIITDNYTRGAYLFYYCDSLTSLDLSNFDTSNMTDMSYMFAYCKNLTTIGDVSNWDTSKVISMANIFYYCDKLTELDVSNWDTSNVTNINSMFHGCYNLTSINVNNWDISKVTNMNQMFAACSKLTSLDVSNWDVGHITASYYFNMTFNSCGKLVDFYPPQNINADTAVNYSTALSHDSLMRIINNLMTTTTTKKLTLGATNLAKLSDEEKAIATGKGWTLA